MMEAARRLSMYLTLWWAEDELAASQCPGCRNFRLVSLQVEEVTTAFASFRPSGSSRRRRYSFAASGFVVKGNLHVFYPTRLKFAKLFDFREWKPHVTWPAIEALHTQNHANQCAWNDGTFQQLQIGHVSCDTQELAQSAVFNVYLYWNVCSWLLGAGQTSRQLTTMPHINLYSSAVALRITALEDDKLRLLQGCSRLLPTHLWSFEPPRLSSAGPSHRLTTDCVACA